MTVFMPEPHILLTVVQGTRSGKPAASAACRAGAWPSPAGSTQPIKTSLTSSAARPARATAALMAVLPSSGAASGASAPWKPPIGVRAMPTMTMGSCAMEVIALLLLRGAAIAAEASNTVPCAGSMLQASRNAGAKRGRRGFSLPHAPLCQGLACSCRIFEQLAPDQPAADLAGPGADLVQFGIAQQASGGKVVDVAVASQELHCIEGDLRGFFGGIQNGTGGVLARGLATIAGLGHRIDISATGIHAGVHIGELALHELEAADRFAKLLALMHVGDDHVERRLHDAKRTRSQHGALVIEAADQHVHAAVYAAEHVFCRHLAVLEHQLAGIGTAHAQLVEFLR